MIQTSRHWIHDHAARLLTYVGMAVLVAITAMLAEIVKTGHFAPVEMIEAFWHVVTHFSTDVASAEVTAVALMRLFGAAE